MANKQLMLPANRAFNADGLPEAGAVAYLYESGTMTPATFYADDGLVTPLGTSLTANGAGRFAVAAYQDETVPFRLRIEDADGNELDDIDPFYFGYLEGATGPQGPNATVLQIGDVTTLAAGSSATATVTHLGSGVYELDLGLPQGVNGGPLSNGNYEDIAVLFGGTSLTVRNDRITNAKLADMAEATIKGRAAGAGSGDPTDLTAAQVAVILDASNIYLRQDATLVHSVPVPASGMVARTTNGAASGTVETTTNKIMYTTLDYDAATPEFAQFQIPMPKSWNEGTVTVQFIWTSGGTGDAVWQARAVAISDGDDYDVAFGSAVSVTDTIGTANKIMTSDFSGALTIGGSPAEGDLVVFEISRNASDAADTLASDAKLVAVRLNFTTNAKDDS